MIGQVSKSLAQRLTRNNAQFANALVRSGPNAKQIAQTYMKYTPPSQRSAAELTQLLIKPGVDSSALKNSSHKLLSDAAFFAGALQQAEESTEDQTNGP
jgi:hypothetical protein